MIESQPILASDSDAREIYLRFSSADVSETIELARGVHLDVNAEGHVVGLEILDANPQLRESLPTLPSTLPLSALLDPWRRD